MVETYTPPPEQETPEADKQQADEADETEASDE